MRTLRFGALGLLAILCFTLVSPVLPARAQDDDPDVPSLPFLKGTVDMDLYLQARDAHIQTLRGLPVNLADNPRLKAILDMNSAVRRMPAFTNFTAWTPIGPYPIPNGQTTTTATAVSGRVTAIAIDPTNANKVYVGCAQGGVWRSLDGGTTWTPIFDNAASLAIGALALAPSNPTILYVGTGEPNLSADSYFGVGLYRIDNVDTSPILNGPFNPTPTTDVIGAKTFTGRTISKILVNPTDPASILVSTSSGIGGLGAAALGASPPITALRGIYRSTNATSGSPSFAKITVTATGSIAPDVTGNRIITDMIYDPTDATGNTVLAWVYGNAAALDGGVYRSTNAWGGSPTFAQTFTTTLSSSRASFAANRVSGVTTILAATQESASGTSCTTGNGCIRRSTDGGVTWSAKLAGGGGFCGGQCWYDIPIAIDPTSASNILIGGAGNSTCSRVFARSTNAGASFSAAGGADVGLHADAHAIAYAPSNPLVVYEGNDGGIFRSNDGGATWVSINTAGFSAAQYQSISVHPIDSKYTIGGTQDNGTQYYRPGGTWFRSDYGDGGFAQIDQGAADTANVTMYHTYYNQQNSLVGYARVTSTAAAFDGNWSFFGNNANGILVSELPIFYAPLVLGPGSPNTVYYGTDRLHRSADQGATNPIVSQGPIVSGASICAIAISPQNDNVRVVGLNNGNVWGTTTGSSTLTNFSAGLPTGVYVGRIAIDPNNANNAYVAFSGFGMAAGAHVYKTSNLLSGTPTWTLSGSGIPDVPVNALVVDPANSQQVFAGTDIGVYASNDGGNSWLPFNTGLPVVAVFDMAIQNPSRTLRIATHGRGMWERLISTTTPVAASIVGSEIDNGNVRLTWFMTNANAQIVNVYRRTVPGDWSIMKQASVDSHQHIEYTDPTTLPGRSYEYALGYSTGISQSLFGHVWVDVPLTNSVGITRVSPNPARSGFTVSYALANNAPASLELVDVTGRVVSTSPISGVGAGVHQVDMGKDGNLSSGVYFVRLNQGGRTSSKRVVVIK